MPHAHDLDEQNRIVHLVDDAVVPDSDAKGTGFAGQGHTSARTGRLAKQVNGRPHPLLLLTRQRNHALDRPPGELHAITADRFRHASPSSALTCSQGT